MNDFDEMNWKINYFIEINTSQEKFFIPASAINLLLQHSRHLRSQLAPV